MEWSSQSIQLLAKAESEAEEQARGASQSLGLQGKLSNKYGKSILAI